MEFLKTHKLHPLIFSINIEENNVSDRKFHVYNTLRSFWYKFRLSDEMKTVFPDIDIPSEFFKDNSVYDNIDFEKVTNLFKVFKNAFVDEKDKFKNSLILLGNKKDFDKTVEFKIVKEIDDETLERIKKLELNEEIEIVNKFMMYYKEYDINFIEHLPEIYESEDYNNGNYIFYLFVLED